MCGVDHPQHVITSMPAVTSREPHPVAESSSADVDSNENETAGGSCSSLFACDTINNSQLIAAVLQVGT